MKQDVTFTVDNKYEWDRVSKALNGKKTTVESSDGRTLLAVTATLDLSKLVVRVATFQVVRVFDGKPATFAELTTKYADMLRYDGVFASPERDGAVFSFRYKGSEARKLTPERWRSFATTVLPGPDLSVREALALQGLVTFMRQDGVTLQPVTLGEVLARRKAGR